MTTQNKKKDDELLMLVIVGAIFTLTLIGLDWGYSSVNEMAPIARIGIWVGHGIVSLLWIVVLANWKNPNYDSFRKALIGVVIVLILIIGIHHAVVREDEQVIIDSQENAAKP